MSELMIETRQALRDPQEGSFRVNRDLYDAGDILESAKKKVTEKLDWAKDDVTAVNEGFMLLARQL